MTTIQIMLSSIEDVKKFVTLTNQYNFPIDLTNEKYKIDAKSIMGVFSLDLSKPVTLEINSDEAGEFLEKVKEFEVTE